MTKSKKFNKFEVMLYSDAFQGHFFILIINTENS